MSLFLAVLTFSCVPVQEGFSAEHSAELVIDTVEELLDGCGITDECDCHLGVFWCDITSILRLIELTILQRHSPVGCLDIVWNPLNKVSRVLVLYGLHLVFDLLHGDLTTEVCGNLFMVRCVEN